MKKITLVCIVFIFSLSHVSNVRCQELHPLYSSILRDYVSNGWVNYKSLKDDKRLQEYVQQLTNTNPDTITDQQDKLAFWINTYNAFTLKIVCDNYPIESINDLHWGGLVIATILGKTVWAKDLVTINGKDISLNEIEYDIISPTFKDPRVHFALVCASRGCPMLRNEAYEGEKIDSQLNEQARLFLNDPEKNSFDTTQHQATISKIFSWFSEDFGDDDDKVLDYIARYLPPDMADNIRKYVDDWDIDYQDYDWRLNGE